MAFQLAGKPGDTEANATEVNLGSLIQRNHMFHRQKAAMNAVFGFPTP